MYSPSRLFLSSLAAAAFFACGGTPAVNPSEDGGTTPDGGASADDAGTAWDGGQPGEGLPCEVKEFLAQNCAGCHGIPLRDGAVGRLLSRGDLLAPSPYHPDKTMGQRALERMGDAQAPMPPAPSSQLLPGEQAPLGNYVAAGMPEGSCTQTSAQTVCTSGIKWTFGNSGSSFMNPGLGCIACHATDFGAPKYSAAGTVYPSAHEQDRCRGSTSVTVRVKDANGQEYATTTNLAGNFFFKQALAKPFTVQVESGGRVRAMHTPLTGGDCNSCHTEQGANGAPGRVMAP